MKTHQFTFALFLLTFFLTGNSEAQPPTIDSLRIIPTNPTTNDTVQLISYTTFAYSGCSLGSSSVSIIGTNITVHTSYNTGIGPAFCNSIDTLVIGKLYAGTYELTCHLADTAPPTTYDIDTIIFTIQQASGFQFIDNLSQEIKVYPNPAITEFTIELKTFLADNDIDIISVLGQKIKTVKENRDIIKIDISDLTDGIYFIVITSGHDRCWTHKIMKNAP